MQNACNRAEPHYGWADVVGDSTQLLSIKPRERPPGVYPDPPPPPPFDDDSDSPRSSWHVLLPWLTLHFR